jgi:hypothetical protein
MRNLLIFFVSVCSLFFLTNKLLAQAPTITSFSPTSGTIGTLVTITGTNLSNIDSIKIGGVYAIKISSTSTKLVAMVMPGSNNGVISVSNISGQRSSLNSFFIGKSNANFIQQGNKLVGTFGSNLGQQGASVSISADGNTAIVGGFNGSDYKNCSWIFTRIGNTWSQQGNGIVVSGLTSPSYNSVTGVDISADGNTAIIGIYNDNNNIGATWIVTRTGNTWSQQGNKLVGTGYSGIPQQGSSVSISADGNTAIVGGDGDSSNTGASWIFTRTGNTWTQQGNKLVGTGYIGSQINQGSSVSISADGNTAIVGGRRDNNEIGASWVFTRTGNTWTQQGNKLVGTGYIGSQINQGSSVSITADGKTAIVGGYLDSNSRGASWIFSYSDTIWAQLGNKLVGSGSNNTVVLQGTGSISADGNTAIVGGWSDGGGQNRGASWIYIKPNIQISENLTIFNNCLGFNSNYQSIAVSVANVLSTFTISAPQGFEISLSPLVNYNSSIILSPVNGQIATTIIYIRLTTLANGILNGNIVFSNNEINTNIPVNGKTNKLTSYIKDFNNIQCLSNNVFKFKDSTIFCGNYSRQWFINNNLYSTDSSFIYSFTSAGIYSVKLLVISTNGEKDSTIKTVKINQNPNIFIIASQTIICKSRPLKLTGSGALNYTWTNGVINDVFFIPDTTKNYQVVGSDINGCFDTANISIEVKPLPIVITTLDKNKITTFQLGASFQWYDCDTKSPIVSATNQIYTATKNGNYAVIVNLNNCIDTSDCVSVLSLSQQEINKESDFNIYPNPNNGTFTIKLSNISSTENKITILDMLGRIVYQTENIIKQDTDNIIVPQLNLMDGLYTIIINSNSVTTFRKSLTIQNTN